MRDDYQNYGSQKAPISMPSCLTRPHVLRTIAPFSSTHKPDGDVLMALNLLAVDDSVTMRKVLEITFAGEDFSVVTADCHKAALEHAPHAQVCLIDTVLGDEDGYALAKAIRKVNPRRPW